MHELAVAQEILALVQRHVPEAQALAVRTVRVRVGELAGVVPESLDFCFGAIVAATPWQQATLAIERVPARARCLACGAVFATSVPGSGCPRCAGGRVQMIAGDELHVDAVDLDDDVPERLDPFAAAGEAATL